MTKKSTRKDWLSLKGQPLADSDFLVDRPAVIQPESPSSPDIGGSLNRKSPTLELLLAEMSEKSMEIDRDWEQMAPVGREIF
ncbi:hypothetical protein ACVBEG_14045 [Pseudomonas sp. GG8]